MPNRKRRILVEYFLTNSRSLAFVAKDDWPAPQIVELKVHPNDIREYCKAKFFGASLASMDLLDWAEWQDGYSELVAPVLKWSAVGDTVWFVPHDVLHSAPLHTLVVDGQALIERNPVCYTPSASVMSYCQSQHTGRRQRVAVFGDSLGDLPRAREEAVSVGELLDGRAYLGPEATRKAVIDMLTKTQNSLDVLHFSCHMRFEPANPLQSAIVLAPDPDAGHVPSGLTGAEILQFKLHADLVTLNGCGSGVSKRHFGDELLGLAGAWLYAGVPTVIVSLWPIDDISAGLLIEQFYIEWLGTAGRIPLSKAESLQRAQIKIKNITAADVQERSVRLLKRAATTDLAGRFLDLAEIQIRASDFPEASRNAEEALNRIGENDGLQSRKRAIELTARASSTLAAPVARSGPDYSVRVFENPYHWGPFVLLGDDR